MGHPVVKIFHVSNLLQMPNDCRMINVEFFGNFLYTSNRVGFDDPLSWSLSTFSGWPSEVNNELNFLKKLIYFNGRISTILWWFCHTFMWISHDTNVSPYPEHPTHLPHHLIPLDCPRALALSALLPALNLHWSSVLHTEIYMFQCYSLKLSHPHLLPQSPKVCSLYLCLCCLAHRILITIFLKSIYLH